MSKHFPPIKFRPISPRFQQSNPEAPEITRGPRRFSEPPYLRSNFVQPLLHAAPGHLQSEFRFYFRLRPPRSRKCFGPIFIDANKVVAAVSAALSRPTRAPLQKVS